MQINSLFISSSTSYVRLACRIPRLIQMHAFLTGLAWPAKENNQNIINVLKKQQSNTTQMPREPPSSNAMRLPGSPAQAPPVLPATCAQEAFPDCRGDRGCFKNHFASVKYCTTFFADCQDAQNRSQKPDSTTGMCYTTCSGETGQVWSWKQHTGSRKGEQPWRRQQHACHTHCSNLPPSFASPAWKLSRPGAIWSSL